MDIHEREEQDFGRGPRLWDADPDVCCAAFQLGACEHTEGLADDAQYEAWQAEQAEKALTHNERIALALLPKDPSDPGWDARARRSAEFLRVNGR